jgi:hypothetical protein
MSEEKKDVNVHVTRRSNDVEALKMTVSDLLQKIEKI